MMSQPNAKGEMYILNDNIDMKAKFVAMERRLEELEMTNMQPVQAISQTPLQAMPCAICLSYEHLGEECPTIPAVMEDFVEAKKSINAQFNQKIDSVESSLNKKMDEVQNDLSQKIDNLQDSISRFANLNTVQEKENSHSQPYQNSMSIHEMEAKEGESSQKREVKEVITLRSGKEVDLPTCKLEHKVERIAKKLKEVFRSEIEQNRSENGAKTGQKQGSARFRSLCEISTLLQNQFATSSPSLQKFSQLRNHFWHTKYFAAAKPLFGTRVPFGSPVHSFRSCEMAAKPQHLKILQRAHHELTCHSRTPISATVGHISITSRSSNYACNISFQILGSQESIASNGARFGFETEKLWPFEDDCANHERKCRTSILLLLDTFLKHFLELKLCIPYLVSKLGKSGVQSFKRYTIWS
ncbi:hypothetical protein AAG906_025616 [Vitis piasezkii]